MADFEVQVEAVSRSNGAFGHINADTGVRWFEYATVSVKDAISAGNYRTVAVGV